MNDLYADLDRRVAAGPQGNCPVDRTSAFLKLCLAQSRGRLLYQPDVNDPIRFSHENPDVQALYAEYPEKPLGHKSHKLLHTRQEARKL